jgi:phosphoesterase family protein
MIFAAIVLPNGWEIHQPPQLMTETDTMPQGAAASPDGKKLAVVESGFNPPTLRLYSTSDLTQVASISLKGAFGRPVWLDGNRILVAGANADAIFVVTVKPQAATAIAMGKGSYPTAVAAHGEEVAVATDTGGSVRIGTLSTVASAKPVRIGRHVGDVTFANGGRTVAASDWSKDRLVLIDAQTLAARSVSTALHPSALLAVGPLLYVAESDNDSVGVYDVLSGQLRSRISVSDGPFSGASPNSLSADKDSVFVTLGAANTVAEIRDGRIVRQMETGWYPTAAVPIAGRLFVIDGKGEGTRPNPLFDAKHRNFLYYIGAIQYGSIRAYDLNNAAMAATPQGQTGWQTQPAAATIVRKDGPIKHVLFILKENRSYDQVLGDMPQGNGDAKLTWFGAKVTPNQHAIAARFGLFDNAYASGEVSESGHNWADGAFANDYVERVWPVNYGDRGNVDDLLSGVGAARPKNGYIWESAQRAHVSFRDYGELTDTPNLTGIGTTNAPSLAGLYDLRYVGWNLDYSDLDRVKEWKREFDAFLRNGNLPQLEWMWLPNDHTYASKPGKPTPEAYVATNDYAVGQIVDTISHSKVWGSTAIFIIEDDAQAGPDHVSDQRTTLYVVSPYARGGVRSEHYSTVSVLRTIELMLGMAPLSKYDAMAVPLYAAFSNTADLRPYAAIAPKIDVRVRNVASAYGAKVSAAMDFSRPDAVDPIVFDRILAHNVRLYSKL